MDTKEYVINQVAKAFDEAEVAKENNDALKADLARWYSGIRYDVYQYGLMMLAKECTGWKVDVRVIDGKPESFSEWLEHAVDPGRIPGFISRDQLVDVAFTPLHEMYLRGCDAN